MARYTKVKLTISRFSVLVTGEDILKRDQGRLHRAHVVGSRWGGVECLAVWYSRDQFIRKQVSTIEIPICKIERAKG